MQKRARTNLDVGLDAHVCVDPGRCRVDDGHTCALVPEHDAAVELSARLGELCAIVDARDEPRVIGGDGVSAPTTQVQGAFSMNIGSVRMTERHLTNDPPTQTQIDEAVADVDEHIDEAFRTVDAGKARTIIGVSGTVTTMTALAMGLKEYDHTVVDGHRLSLEDAYAVDDKFLRMTRAERREYKTIHPGRIDVVGGGAVVWSRVLARVSEAAKADHGEAIDSFVASEHGLLDGIVLDYGRRLLAQ